MVQGHGDGGEKNREEMKMGGKFMGASQSAP